MADQSVSVESAEEKGVARIKPEFIVTDHVPLLAENCLAQADKETFVNETAVAGETEEIKTEGNGECVEKKRLSKSEKKKLRGQNKARPPPYKVNKEVILCHTLVDLLEGETAEPCRNQRCTNMHDVKAFMAIRPPDIGATCHNFNVRGRCPRGLTCRFGSIHITEDGFNKINKEAWEKFSARSNPPTMNILTKELQTALRKRTYDLTKSEKILEASKKTPQSQTKGTKRTVEGEVKIETKAEVVLKSEAVSDVVETNDPLLVKKEIDDSSVDVEMKDTSTSDRIGPVSDEDLIKIKPAEKKKIDWKGKLLMSPLTTVGNLPFRRICKEFGVDVTCGEMAMATSIIQGFPQEWALVKKHESEDIFGVQLCGNNPYTMTKCAQVLQETMEVDFIDINMGCPIDLVYREGGGTGLLRRERVLQSIIDSMNKVMTIPLTVKTRTGIVMGKNIAHNFVPYFRDLGASLITIHGRSREQRYTRSADWNYVDECAKIAHPVPLFGNGDILSYDDYKHVTETYKNISGVMIGRGALIKPWIFTEIKEQRLWDISSQERFDILKKYVNYGLEHWGSDTKGVENTRRFLLEWLSFLHRYIPVGILEQPPQKINERPPVFRGRDELETLMASPNCAHWIEISEMLLGPVPEGFHFLPKHKANSWK
ncbi:hypothetical protein ONE63_002090 [Megalurothrips usitatus]|uniref:tRNA-dihydrouridine(47) synthase [NAD(P)(+)] n=1 Tax=Megalurothrips usitatus TaxID=439358 RepID=A0AAV7XGQ1_9NEOP|nr:hypothetical protein ONE63_002090 [Megalurothrips usitatus]